MTKESISTLFSEGLLWNGILYSLYKILSLGATCFLYMVLPTHEYNMWALVQSTIFMLVLILDCGMKKTIPRYILLFAKNKKTYTTFLVWLFVATLCITFFIGIPLLYYITTHYLSLVVYKEKKALLAFLLLGETLLATIATLYHSHFMQKYYYSLYLVCFAAEMALVSLCATGYYTSIPFIVSFLYIKLFFCIVMVISTLYYVPLLYKTIFQRYQDLEEKPTIPHYKEIVFHALSMWASTSLKALTEKNGLFPFITTTYGTTVANCFKVTHDCTLFFQRIALKTIGINDIAALSYELTNQTTTIISYKTTTIIKHKIMILCSSIFLIGSSVGIFYHYYYKGAFLFPLFLLSLSCYMIEILLSPFERVLEAQQKYSALWIRYSPYIILITMLLFFKWYINWSLFTCMLYIHLTRLVSALLMLY